MKLTPAETPIQAKEWGATKQHYLEAGLCHICAAQAAWGHQQHAGGFSAINPPCDKCRTVTLPPAMVAKHGTRGVDWLAKR